MKYIGLFLVIFLSIGANLPDSMIARLGLEPNYLLAALAAIIITWLMAHRDALLFIIVAILVTAINIPEETASSIGFDRDFVFAALIAIIILPTIKKLFDW